MGDSNFSDYRGETSNFVECISKLNAVANTERKGRTDLSADILDDALKFWRCRQGADRPSVELPNPRKNQNPNEHEGFGKIQSNASNTSSNSSETSRLEGVKKQLFGILRSVTDSTKSVHSSSKVVRFFPEQNDCEEYKTTVDDASDASTASTEEYKGPTDISLINKDSSFCSVASADEEPEKDMSAAQCLAGDVVESYWHIRYYLRDISNSLERVDPNLSSNNDLVSRLEDWEESWEVGRDYVHDAEMLPIVCELVTFLKKAEKLEPAFAEMTQECGAEFCLCLPRLVWLYFLQNPGSNVKLLQRFLPHHFISESEASEHLWDSCISDLLCRYQDAQREAEKVAGEGCNVNSYLVQSVIAGPNSESQPGPKSDSNALVHAIEERSMELQRHQPENWNHFMMVIVRCFSDGQPKNRQRMGPKAPVPKIQASRRSLWRRRPRLRTMPFMPTTACPDSNSN